MYKSSRRLASLTLVWQPIIEKETLNSNDISSRADCMKFLDFLSCQLSLMAISPGWFSWLHPVSAQHWNLCWSANTSVFTSRRTEGNVAYKFVFTFPAVFSTFSMSFLVWFVMWEVSGSTTASLVGWDCRIHLLRLCSWVRLPQLVSWWSCWLGVLNIPTASLQKGKTPPISVLVARSAGTVKLLASL